ncbi:iron-containing redox enzyme family protein [Streptomyces sp. J2-1]|uniref:iron-containing redox enzyme family protein n=1 Tax=Streptomyces corallincola TaxID=2851888 RepID=UPI001C385385|nr:iron-containing redox enzyme family protein [Streptomyces corallincola]MBV2357191.1 iron-containing redox enzyme family protein [Streptomyces corallincola]
MNDHRAPALPPPRGPLSEGVLALLTRTAPLPHPPHARTADPYGDDLQLALYLCYELHYRGFAGVSEALEWNPELLERRAELEDRFLGALDKDTPRHPDLDQALADLLTEPLDGTGVSHYLQAEGELWQLREYAALRSLYHLKEADPHAWVLPRLHGRAKAAMAAVEFDEFGGGHADRVHAHLFAELMGDLGLDSAYGRHLPAGTAEMLAVVNMMSLFGLHRDLRGALIGHFADVEITSSPASRRLAAAMRRNGAGPAAAFFYDEHVEADAVHEQIVRHDVIGGLLAEEPELTDDVVFGIDATEFLEDRLARRLLTAWRAGRTALFAPVEPDISHTS